MGDFSAAGDGFEQALALYQETGAKHRQGIILSELCHIHTVLGEFSAAHQRLQDAFALSLETGEISIRVNLHLLAGWLALEVGDLAGAERAMAQTDALLPDNQTMEQVCLAYLAWSRFWQYRGQLAKACVFGDKALALARSQEKRKLPNCAIRLGLALLKMEQPAAARDLFAEALQIWEERNQPHLAAEARAGLALAALARDELATAVTHVEAILQFLDRPALPNSFLGLQEPGQTYLTCFRVLQAVGDGRGTAVLEEALAFLQKRAATLDETQRQSFWENIPSHRRLAAAVKEGEIKGS